MQIKQDIPLVLDYQRAKAMDRLETF